MCTLEDTNFRRCCEFGPSLTAHRRLGTSVTDIRDGLQARCKQRGYPEDTSRAPSAGRRLHHRDSALTEKSDGDSICGLPSRIARAGAWRRLAVAQYAVHVLQMIQQRPESRLALSGGTILATPFARPWKRAIRSPASSTFRRDSPTGTSVAWMCRPHRREEHSIGHVPALALRARRRRPLDLRAFLTSREEITARWKR